MKLFSTTALLALCLEALLHSSLLTGLCEGGGRPRALAEAPAKEPATTTKNNTTNATGGVTATNATSEDANLGMNVTVDLLSDVSGGAPRRWSHAVVTLSPSRCEAARGSPKS